MKRLTSLFLILTCLALISCEDDDTDCSLIKCVSPGIRFQFIDNDSNENLLENESIDADDIQISVSNIGSTEVQVSNNRSEVFLFVENWPDGNHTVTTTLNSKIIFEMSLDTEKVKSKCCSSIEISNPQIINGQYTEDGYFSYRIFIE